MLTYSEATAKGHINEPSLEFQGEWQGSGFQKRFGTEPFKLKPEGSWSNLSLKSSAFQSRESPPVPHLEFVDKNAHHDDLNSLPHEVRGGLFPGSSDFNSDPDSFLEEEKLVDGGKRKPNEYFVSLIALYIARSLDIKGLLSGPFRNLSYHFVRNHAVVRFPDGSRASPSSASLPKSANEGSMPGQDERYLVAFQYGSVVFLNFSIEDQKNVLATILPFCSEVFPEVRKDDYGVVVCPSLPVWSEGGQDHVVVRQLDLNSIRVISSVLGQSVAMDCYAKTVDDMVNTFSELNRGMENTGTFTMKRKKLFQLVAAANTTLADVILRVGLLEKSDTAWKFAQYAKIWEFMRYEFELEQRFESLDFKVNIIQHNVRFFLEILQNRKSDTLEWIIILLIAGEICVSLYEIISKAVESSRPSDTTVLAIE